MNRSFVLATFAAAAVSAGASAASAATVLAVPASSLCKGACFSETQRTYQKTWSASDFQGPVSISALALDKALLGNMQNYAVRVSFQDADGNTVSTWGSYTLAVLGGQVVTLGGQEVNWDTARGDLTLKLELLIPDKGGLGGGGFGGGGGGGGGFGWAASSGPAALGPGDVDSLAVPPSLGGGMLANNDLMPPVVEPALVAVPEPATWAMMIMGFFGAGTLVRNRRRALLRV